MRFAFYLIITSVILFSCATPKKYMEKGMYDMAVKQAVKKIRKKPNHAKSIYALEKSYPIANGQDNEKIKFLKLEGKPDSWDDIYLLYERLKQRQNLVKTVIPINFEGRMITFPMIDYDNEIVQSKQNAAEYFYANAQKLIQNGNKEDCRKAFYELQKVKSFFTNYKDVDNLILKARELGTSWAHVTYGNQSFLKMPDEYLKTLVPLDLPRFNSEWVQYTDKNISNPDYKVIVSLTIIDVSPEKIMENATIDTKQVQDGWDYFLDSKGNVMKDSLGNDIKKPKYKILSCKVITTKQTKAAHVEGKIEYINSYNNQVLKTIPVAADNYFNHTWAMIQGDIEALKEEHKKYLNSKPLPFPADFDMINQASNTLRDLINKAFIDNKYILK